MTNEEVTKIVHTAILNYRGPASSTENPKLDFKAQWKDIKNDTNATLDFIKDVTAIANTFGLDGYLIYGVEEKNGKLLFHNTHLEDSGLKNDRELIHVVNRQVNPYLSLNHYVVEYDNCLLSVIHIPPSLEKPHFVLKGKDDAPLVYVRKGANNAYATRHDIELMYYDRKNIVPEYRLLASSLGTIIKLDGGYGNQLPVIEFQNITFENLGQRYISIIGLLLVLSENEETIAKLQLNKWSVLIGQNHPERSALQYTPITVKQKDITSIVHAQFADLNLRGKTNEAQKLVNLLNEAKGRLNFELEISLSSTQQLKVKLDIISH